jgi:hypothetical protein
MNNLNIVWNTERQNQGQIVTKMYPQLSGAAEGNEGPAKGLRLTYDACNGEWVLRKGNKEIARGNQFKGQGQPTVTEAMQMARAAR